MKKLKYKIQYANLETPKQLTGYTYVPPITETSKTWVTDPISEAHTAVQQPRCKQITRKLLRQEMAKKKPGWVNEGSLLQKGAHNAVPISWKGEPIVLDHQHLGLFRHRNNSKPRSMHESISLFFFFLPQTAIAIANSRYLSCCQ